MMKRNIDNLLCESAEGVVPYLYQEMAEHEVNVFETHLAGCSSCTDEFAAVADARFSVYEWHKEEFVPLATPHFTVPSDVPARIGVFAQIAAIFARPSFAAAGAFAILLMLTLVAFNLFRRTEQQIASNVAVPEVRTTTAEVVTTAALPKVEDVADVEPVAIKTEPIRPYKVSKVKTQVVPKASKAKDIGSDEQLRQARRAPALSNDVELEDESLRLTDLFDEVGG